MTKTEFVQQQPADVSTQEVIRRARAEGIRLSPATVYAARRGTKRVRGGRGFSDDEIRFAESLMQVGFLRATELIDELRSLTSS